MNCITKDSSEVRFLKNIDRYKKQIKDTQIPPHIRFMPLEKGCLCFSIENLEKIEKALATAWIILFQLYSENIERKKFKAACTNFKLVFKAKCVKTLFFRGVVSVCMEELQNHNLDLLKRVFDELSNRLSKEKSFPHMGRKTAICWVNLFENHEPLLEREGLGRIFKAIHERYVLKPLEIKKHVTIICRDNITNKFPLIFLLMHRKFQKILTHGSISLKHTTIRTIEAFQQYMWTPPQKASIPTTHFVELLDFARWVNDTKLMELCLEKISSQKDKGPSERASNFAVQGEIALGNGNCKEAKVHFLYALSFRSTDFLSYAALGKMAMKKEKYKKATKNFEEASKYAHNEYKFYIYQAKAIVAHVQQLEKNGRGVNGCLGMASAITRIMAFGETVNYLLTDFFKMLRAYCEKELQLQFYDALDRWETLAKSNQFKYEDFHQIHAGLNHIIDEVKKDLLIQAEMLLEKKQPHLLQEKIPSLLLKAEIQYEKAEFEQAQKNFESIITDVKEKKVILQKKEGVHLLYTLAKVYIKRNLMDEAKEAFLAAINLAPGHEEEIERSYLCFLLDLEKPFWHLREESLGEVSAFLEKNTKDMEVHYGYALALFHQERFEEAEKHFAKADSSKAHVNYFFGKASKHKDYYFKKALKVAIVDALEYEYCLDIAEHFLTSKEKNVWIEIERLFQDRWRIDPKRRLGECYLQESKFEKAIMCFGDLCKQNPKNSKLHFLYAKALFHGNKFEEAKEHFLRAASDKAHANYFLGKITPERRGYFFRKALEEALEDVNSQEVLEYDQLLEIAEHFVQFLKEEGDPRIEVLWIKVEQLFQRFWQINISFELGKYYLEKGISEKAITCFKYLCKKYPKDPDMFVLLGLGYYKAKEFNLAAQTLKEARKIDPENIHAYICMIQLSEVNGIKAIKNKLNFISNFPKLNEEVYCVFPSFVKYLDISELDKVRRVFQNIVDKGNATLLHYCYLAKIYQDTEIPADLPSSGALSDQNSSQSTNEAKRYYEIIAAWDNDEGIRSEWREFLSIGTYSLKQNDLQIASDIAMRLFKISKDAHNIEDIGKGLIELFKQMAQVAVSLANFWDSPHPLKELLAFIQECFKIAEHFDTESKGGIQKIGICLVLIALDVEKNPADVEFITFFEYFAYMPYVFECEEVDKELVNIIEEYIQTIKESEVVPETSETCKISLLLNVLLSQFSNARAIKQGLLDHKIN